MLLNLSYEEQELFEKQFRRVRRDVINDKFAPAPGGGYVMPSGAENRRGVVIGLAYKGVEKEQRNNMIAEIALEAFRKEPVGKVLVIGVNAERAFEDTYPYGVLTCVFREELADLLDE